MPYNHHPRQFGWVVGATVLKKIDVYEIAGSTARGNATAIETMKVTNADDAVYNLSGQKVSSSYKGIVIKNGKKYLVK